MSGTFARFMKQSFHEVPHLYLGSAFFVFSVGLCCIATRRHVKYDIDRRTWKRRYTVVREEDFDPKKQVHLPGKHYPIF